MDGSFAMELAKVILQKLGFASSEPPCMVKIIIKNNVSLRMIKIKIFGRF
jgi:hypothetical protein